MVERMQLWTFVAEGQKDVLAAWARQNSFPKRELARLDQKLDMLATFPFDTLIHSHMLAGPIAKQRHIYKLRVTGDVAIRVMLCKGPLPGEAGYTLLLGAVERDRRLEPANAPALASTNRDVVLQDPVRRRKKYERFG